MNFILGPGFELLTIRVDNIVWISSSQNPTSNVIRCVIRFEGRDWGWGECPDGAAAIAAQRATPISDILTYLVGQKDLHFALKSALPIFT